MPLSWWHQSRRSFEICPLWEVVLQKINNFIKHGSVFTSGYSCKQVIDDFEFLNSVSLVQIKSSPLDEVQKLY
jgi:hypothetical protein